MNHLDPDPSLCKPAGTCSMQPPWPPLKHRRNTYRIIGASPSKSKKFSANQSMKTKTETYVVLYLAILNNGTMNMQLQMTIQCAKVSSFSCVLSSEMAWPDHSSQSCFLTSHQLFPMMVISTVCVRQDFCFP